MISFHKYVFLNLFLVSKFDSVSELGCKQQISLYALGVKKYNEIASLCLFTEFSILIGCISLFFVYFYWSVRFRFFVFIPKF